MKNALGINGTFSSTRSKDELATCSTINPSDTSCSYFALLAVSRIRCVDQRGVLYHLFPCQDVLRLRSAFSLARSGRNEGYVSTDSQIFCLVGLCLCRRDLWRTCNKIPPVGSQRDSHSIHHDERYDIVGIGPSDVSDNASTRKRQAWTIPVVQNAHELHNHSRSAHPVGHPGRHHPVQSELGIWAWQYQEFLVCIVECRALH